MLIALQKNRALRCGAVFLSAVVLVGFAHVPILRGVASFLIVEDSLRPAAAIVPLAGEIPFREMEAAKLYRAGWAPRIIIKPTAPREEAKAFEEMGIAVSEQWELRREVLLQQGVPAAAILIPKAGAEGTLEELQAAYRELGSKDSPVILVTSKYHTRRTRLTWQHVSAGRSPGIVRSASRDPFDPKQWWRERRFVLSVVREYLGLINYYAGFPVAP
jgi:uncharacterized SAM-binding protein YcdF (DUF218 family)